MDPIITNDGDFYSLVASGELYNLFDRHPRLEVHIPLGNFRFGEANGSSDRDNEGVSKKVAHMQEKVGRDYYVVPVANIVRSDRHGNIEEMAYSIKITKAVPEGSRHA